MVLGYVLGDFLVPKREAKGKGRICGNACFTLQILLFSWFGDSIWNVKMRGKQSGIPILIKTQFYGDFGFVLRIILVAQIDEKSSDKSMDFGGIPGGVPRLRALAHLRGTGLSIGLTVT